MVIHKPQMHYGLTRLLAFHPHRRPNGGLYNITVIAHQGRRPHTRHSRSSPLVVGVSFRLPPPSSFPNIAVSRPLTPTAAGEVHETVQHPFHYEPKEPPHLHTSPLDPSALDRWKAALMIPRSRLQPLLGQFLNTLPWEPEDRLVTYEYYLHSSSPQWIIPAGPRCAHLRARYHGFGATQALRHVLNMHFLAASVSAAVPKASTSKVAFVKVALVYVDRYPNRNSTCERTQEPSS